jgi:hypothetical protein
MYLNSRQYPELAKFSRKEKIKSLGEAIANEGKWIRRRFLLVVICGIAFFYFLEKILFSIESDTWGSLIVPLIFGLLFYSYLLWEINGPIHSAVRSYIKRNKESLRNENT